MKKLILVAALALISFAFLRADVHVKMDAKIVAGGQPERTVPQEQWLGKNKMATVGGGRSMIIDMEKKKLYIVFDNIKTYVETDLPLDMGKIAPEAFAPMLKQGMESQTFSIQPNGETKKILDWNAKGYAIKMNIMGQDQTITLWTSTDLPFDWKKYKNIFSEYYKAQLKLGDKALAEFQKIEGYVLASEINISSMGGQFILNTTVTEINTKAKPTSDVYTPPAGYTKQDRIPAGQ